ncbi:LapA family protein [Falsibacillus pallidus]|uniref:Putative integral membrane protein n=1 Tax=Falsibacillus pallidus TaxID=493781 RepID=A0A370GLH9_9BACI|nr:lipopolysaccharide assembly LapA domain-containing protein [Falsibacillus pallidus]RDI44116.1 putative integral membrane protein [Falsibacillus pallidus]
MKFQWTLLFGIVFALIVAIFAVINVDNVEVNYLFGTAEWPLILVILGSVFMGGIIIGSVGFVRMYSLQRKVKQLEKQNAALQEELNKNSAFKSEESTFNKKNIPDHIDGHEGE